MLPIARTLMVLALLGAFPELAEAAAAPLKAGDRVLVPGAQHRKCSAHISSIPSPGYARLQFDRAGCGDAAVPYEMRHLQRITFSPKAHDLAEGDAVVVKGYFGNACSGRVREVSRSGYTSVDLDSLLCADTAGLFKYQDVKKVQYVPEAAAGDRQFGLGEKVTAKGIHDGDVCRGEIRKLTDSGLALVAFDELTCAYAGKLYSLDDLKEYKAKAPRRHASGELIFQRVMREIASQKKTKKHARL
jgi:hypothetical protein